MQRTPGLDTLRAIAIVWVMLFHSYLVGGLGDGFSMLERSGWMGVDLFFVLSGYLIGTQVLRSLHATGTLDLADFYRRRAVRILPAFLVVLATYVALPGWRETPGMQPLWQFPTFTFNLLFDNPENYAFSHVWSLCVEEHFYLVFPLLALALVRRASARTVAAISLAIVVGGMLLRAWLWSTRLAPALAGDGEGAGLPYLRYLYYPTWSRLDGLVAGVALSAAGVFRPVPMARVRAHATALLALGLLIVGGMLVLFDGARMDFWPCVVGYPALALGMAVLVAAASGGTWLARLSVPGAAWLARASYSLYLCHKLVFTLVQTSLDGHMAEHRFLRFGIYAVATLAGGALLHYTIERPFLRWRDRFRKPSATLSPPKVIHGGSAAD